MIRPKVVIIGGGTGTYVVGTGLKQYDLDLTAIVTVADNGGSTGRLRDEFGFQPVGDLRQALAAFAQSDDATNIRKLLLYRFTKGSGLEGHNLGNLILTALQDMTGSTPKAVEVAAKIFRLNGQIYPITTKNIELVIEYEDGTFAIGESWLDETNNGGKKIIAVKTSPRATIYSKAKAAIEKSDFIIIGPGDLYGSIMPHFVIEGTAAALKNSSAALIYNANLMSKFAQTNQMSINDHIRVIEQAMDRKFDYVIINKTPIPTHILEAYAKEHEFPLTDDVDTSQYIVCREDLLARTNRMYHQPTSDMVKRSFIRHDSVKIASVIAKKIIHRDK